MFLSVNRSRILFNVWQRGPLCASCGEIEKKYVYRITEKGEDLYEYLQTTPIAAILGNSDVQLVRRVNTAMALPAGVILKRIEALVGFLENGPRRQLPGPSL
jgi:hypothetical protein